MNSINGIPQIGLGLWKVERDEEFLSAFNSAIEAGYRHFDSAQIYGNEDLLGLAWTKSGVDRKELFLTTKISVTKFGYKRALKSFDESLLKLQSDYVDLLLLHFPVTGLRKGSWKALEEIYQAGKAKSIGVSNYTIRHLEEMKDYAKIIPQVNQVELHVFLQQPELVEYCSENDITLEAYSPLAHAKDMDNEVIDSIAKKHHKTYAQVMLRWCIEKGLVVLPKSVTPKRIKQNIDVFDFSLDESDMKKLARLDKNLRTCWNPTLVP